MIHYTLWLGAARWADQPAAVQLYVELFRRMELSLTFADPLWRAGAPVEPVKALGQEDYGKALDYIQKRNFVIEFLIQADSDALVNEAKAMVESETGMVPATQYLLTQVSRHPELRQFLLDKRRSQNSHLYQSPMLGALAGDKPEE